MKDGLFRGKDNPDEIFITMLTPTHRNSQDEVIVYATLDNPKTPRWLTKSEFEEMTVLLTEEEAKELIENFMKTLSTTEGCACGKTSCDTCE